MQYSKLFQDTVTSLEKAGIENAQFDAVLLFDFCFGLSRSQLFLYGDQEVPDEEIADFKEILKRRLAREPLQYITGVREFWSLDFLVTPSVLIPRPETEFLLECVLAVRNQYACPFNRVLDMCTGSGVIAVVLARELQAGMVVAVDQSADALKVASLNRKKYDLTDHIHFVCSDLFAALSPKMKYELIVSNPPYIAGHDFDTLQPEVKHWEPRSALLAGKEGLDVIARMADTAHTFLAPEGWLFVEIGADQKDEVEKLFSEHHSSAYEEVEVVSDWSGRPRVLKAKKVKRLHG